jgi:flagellar basal body-associated protein FliL
MGLGNDFLGKLILLLVTAAISGAVIPYYLKQTELRRVEQGKTADAEKARQGKVIEAQSTLIDDVTSALWKWRYIYMKITYYGDGHDESRYAAASEAYDQEIWDALSLYRYQVTRARRLVSETAYRQLVDFYHEMTRMDNELSVIVKEHDAIRKESLSALNGRIYTETTPKIDELVHWIAVEAHLTADRS